MTITGGILAGGEGRRFGGADKGLLSLGERTFVETVRDALAPQVDEIVVSANRNVPRYASFGHRVVCDDVGAGPAAGLLRIMETASHPWVLCVPCDALSLPPTLARDMQDAQWAEEADIVLLHDGARVHPTCCLVLRSLACDLRRYLGQGHSALWRWQSRYRVAHLECQTPFVNVNDAGALAAFAQGGRSPDSGTRGQA
jgi:molybdopterin-guanine dinucleotide biosynthesis protein A